MALPPPEGLTQKFVHLADINLENIANLTNTYRFFRCILIVTGNPGESLLVDELIIKQFSSNVRKELAQIFTLDLPDRK